MIKAGIYNNLSSEEYHADKDSLSRSSLKDYSKSPHYYWSMHLNPSRPERVETDEMRFGTAFHTLILEPERFQKEYETEPERVLLKDVGRELYDAYKAQCEALKRSNKIVLSDDEMRLLGEMSIALLKNNKVRDLLLDGIVERSYFWEDAHSGLMLKARPDVLQSNMIIDIKTINDASVYSFQKNMVSGWYHVQGAMIRDAINTLEGTNISNVINICIEKKYPYSVGIYIIDESALDYGHQLYKNILLDMKASIVNKDFRDLEIQTVGLPKWAL